jgi:hypothetical protein
MKPQITAAAALVAGIGGAAVFVLGTGTATAAADNHSQSVQTLGLTLRYADAASHFIGKDANQPAIGDRYIDTAALRSSGKVVGQATNICTLVAGTSEATFITQCAGTFTLARGEITTTGADDSSDTTTDAVTGGTGTFAYATGTATTVSGSDAATITIRYITTR